MEEPTCVFSGMIWEGASIDGLGYFTEGEEKGEFISVFLPNGGRSRKYAYYGDLPLTFYREVEVEDKNKLKSTASLNQRVSADSQVYLTGGKASANGGCLGGRNVPGE